MMKTPASPTAVAPSVSIRVASADDNIAVSLSMANAFQDDPSFAWCIPDSADRMQHLPAFFGVSFDALLGLGHSTAPPMEQPRRCGCHLVLNP